MGVMTVEDYQSQYGAERQPATSGVMSADEYKASQDIEPVEEKSSFWGQAGDLAMEGLDYISTPKEDTTAMATHNIVKDKYKSEILEDKKAGPTGNQEPSLDDNYIFSLTQEMMDQGLGKGDSVKVLRELEKRTGERVGAKESQLIRRYLKSPGTDRGVGPGQALMSGAQNLGAGLARTAGGLGTMIGDAAEMVGADETGQAIKDVSQDVSAWADAHVEIGKDRAGSNPLAEVGAIAPMMATPGGVIKGAATAFSAGYGYGRGQGMEESQAATAGAVDAVLVGGINRLVKGLQGGQVSADELAEKGVKALDKRWVLTDKRDLIKRIEKTTGKSADEALKDVAKYMKTIDTENLTEDQVVRMVTQHMTGGADFSPRAGKYLGKAESLNSTTAPKVMQEAQDRVNDIRQGIENPELNELIESFVTKNGNYEAMDWNGLHNALKDKGLPTDGPLMTKIDSYKTMDDVTLVNQMQGANPVSGQNVSEVGQRGDWGAQAEAEYMNKVRQFVLSNIPGVNVDEKVVRSIMKSAHQKGITPKILKKNMVESGVNASGLTDEALQNLIDEAGPVPDVGEGMPKNTYGNAQRPEDGMPLLDEAEVDAKINHDLSGAEPYGRTSETPTTDSIIKEFGEYGEQLDEVLQAGMDKGLKGHELRNFIRYELKGSEDVALGKPEASTLDDVDREILHGWGEGGSYKWKDTPEEKALIDTLEKGGRTTNMGGNIIRHGNPQLDLGNFKVGDTVATDRLLSGEKPGGNYQGRHDVDGRTIINVEEGDVYDFSKYGLPDADLEKEVILPKGAKLQIDEHIKKGDIVTKKHPFIEGETYTEEAVEDIVRATLRPGFSSSDNIIRMGQAGTGAAGGAVADEENPLRGAIIGGVAGGAISPKITMDAAGQAAGKVLDSAYSPVKSMVGDVKPNTNELDAFWSGASANDNVTRIAGKFPNADMDTLKEAVTRGEGLDMEGAQLEKFTREYLDARGSLYSNADMLDDVDTALAEVTDDFVTNPMAPSGLAKLKADKEAGTTEALMFYDGAHELYIPTKENVIEPAAWEGNDDLLQRIDDFTRDEDDAVLNATRAPDADLLDDLREYPENFSGTVYRGTRLKGAQKQMFDALSPGDIVSNSSLMSTSTSPSISREFMEEPKNLIIKQKMGYPEETLRHPFAVTFKGKGHDISAHSSMGEEEEVIMTKGKWFNVLDKRDTDGVNHMLLEEIDPQIIAALKQKGVTPNQDILKLLGTTGAVGGAASQIDEIQQ